MGRIFVTTNMAAASAATATMFLTWLRYGKPDVSMTLNGALAGLVAITAGRDAVSVPGAFVIGIIAGLVIVFAVEFLTRLPESTILSAQFRYMESVVRWARCWLVFLQ